MEEYFRLSTQLFKCQNFNEGNRVQFLCSPQAILDDQTAQVYFDVVRYGIATAGGLGRFIKILTHSITERKYLFLLSLLLCIQPDERATNRENGYWDTYKRNLGKIPNEDQKAAILEMLKRFCEKRNIPFFDIYQNTRRTNFCGRIYSLLPFAREELYGMGYLFQREQVDDPCDFSIVCEIALSGYQNIFNATTIEAMGNRNDPVRILKEQIDTLPNGIANWGDYFQAFLDVYTTEIRGLEIPEGFQNKFGEKLADGGNPAPMTLDSLEFYFRVGVGGRVTHFITQPKRGAYANMQVTDITEANARASYTWVEIQSGGQIRRLKLPSGGFIVTREQFNGEWLKIRFSKARKLYLNEMAGYVNVINIEQQIDNRIHSNALDGFLKYVPANPQDIPEYILREYDNIDDGTFIEMTGGLTAGHGTYFWFALPLLVVHNRPARDIEMRFNGEVVMAQIEGLNERFERHIQNRIRNGNTIPFGEGEAQLEFVLGKRVLHSLKIKSPNIEMPFLPREGHPFDSTHPLGIRECNAGQFNNNYGDIDLIEKDEHLLHWITWYGDKGVDYAQFRNAVNEIYRNLNHRFQNGEPGLDTVKLTKRVLEQFIGLGYIDTSISGGRIRYMSQPACFLSTHDGYLLLSGGRAWPETKRLLDEVRPTQSGDVVVDGVALPRIFKLDPTAILTKMNLDRNDICLAIYGFKGFQIVRGGLGNRASYPLSILIQFSISEMEKTILGPGESLLSGNVTYLRYDPKTLDYVEICSISELKQFDIFKPVQSYKPVLYVFQRQEYRDGEPWIFANEVLLGNHHEAVYFSLSMCNYGIRTNIGWIYDKKNHKLYIPRRVNMPNQIRHSLQCVVGSYTTVRYALQDLKKMEALLPEFDEKGIKWCTQQKNAYELEEFSCIPNSFIEPLEEKLSIIINILPL